MRQAIKPGARMPAMDLSPAGAARGRAPISQTLELMEAAWQTARPPPCARDRRQRRYDSPTAERLEKIWEDRAGLLGWLSTVDHKEIGKRYLVTAFAVPDASAASRRW